MSEKLCCFCQHFSWNKISMYDYGGETGAGIDGGGMRCGKGMLEKLRDGAIRDFDEMPTDEDDFRALMLTAERCKKYFPVKL